MSLHLIESTHQEQLAEVLVANISEADFSDDSLGATTVIVQNAGLGRWLRLWHARRCGISAAVKMPFAQSFITQELGQHDLFDRNRELSPVVMRWQIFDLLQGRIFESWAHAEPLQNYLSADHTNIERRNWSLAGKLADLFDRYAVHRPEWIHLWLEGNEPDGSLPHMQWQAQLFRSMVERMELSRDDVMRRLSGLALPRFLEAKQSSPGGERPVHVFGITSFPASYLAFFQALAQSTDVYLYHLIPSDAYLGDLPKNFRESLLADLEEGESGQHAAEFLQNPLLVANGQSAARFQSLLLALDFPTGEMPDYAEETLNTDLLNLQRSLRLNEASCDFDADGSVSIHRCHSGMREVQVLQQQLLAQFAADPTLKPEEIIVLVPEISEYTDAINTVFGIGTRMETDADAVRIPFCIADQRSSGDENCWRFFMSLLTLLKGRQLFSEVACLLDFDPVCQRLGFERDLLKELLDLMQGVGVRWGIDAHSREKAGLPGYSEYSWEHGLERIYDGLIYGEGGPADRAPQVTSSQLQEAVGALTQLLRPVFALAGTSSEKKSFKEWSDGLLKVLQQILSYESQSGGEWMRLLANVIGEHKVHATDAPISLDTFCIMLGEGDLSVSGPSGLLRRGVTFCRLQPARHIPSRVVCILGLDEGSYPRDGARNEFDLIDLHSRHAKSLRGSDLHYKELHYLADSRVRDEDRQLFLDCLLNARERLYLSFVGQSDLTNEDLPPSLLVSELTQFLERVPGATPELREERIQQVRRVIVRHPLQDWSSENFKYPQPCLGEVPVPVHFNSEYAETKREQTEPKPFMDEPEVAVVEADVAKTLSADHLLRFLKDPAKDYLSHQLHVRLDQLKWLDAHYDHEAFDLDGLAGWALRQQILDAWLSAKQSERLDSDFASALKRSWQQDLTLPLGHAGEAIWENQVSPILQLLEDHLGSEVLLKDGFNIVFQGIRYEHEYWKTSGGQRLIFLGGSPQSPKYLLEAFIRHISSSQGSLIFDLKKQECIAWPVFAVAEGAERDIGVEWLQQLVPIWLEGQSTAVPFSIEIAHAYLSDVRKNGEELDPVEALTKAYTSKWLSYTGYGQDCSEAQSLCFNGDSPASPHAAEPIRETFARNAETIFGPVLEWADYLKTEKGR